MKLGIYQHPLRDIDFAFEDGSDFYNIVFETNNCNIRKNGCGTIQSTMLPSRFTIIEKIPKMATLLDIFNFLEQHIYMKQSLFGSLSEINTEKRQKIFECLQLLPADITNIILDYTGYIVGFGEGMFGETSKEIGGLLMQIQFCNLGFTNVITNIDSIRDEFLRMTCQDFVTKYHGYSELVILYLN